MAEAARRYQQQAGSADLVRRLIARPVRLEHQTRTRLQPHDLAPEAADLELDRAPETEAPEDVTRLETELAVLKAVLQAQRREVEGLRAQRQLLTESTADDDVRATRERWATLVDSLLIRAR